MRINPGIMGINLLAPLVLGAVAAGQAVAGDMAVIRGEHMVFLSGTTHGAVEACGGSVSAKLEDMARRQKAGSLEMGSSETVLDAKFKEGYEAGKMSVESFSPEKRAESCDGLRANGLMEG